MSWVLLGLIGVLLTVGIYLMLDDDLLRTVMGFSLLSHAVNIVILTSSLRILPQAEVVADPTAQAMVLTALVITTAVLSLLAGVAAWGTEAERGEEEP